MYTQPNQPLPEDILGFWFSQESQPLWFAKNNEFDTLITNKFYNIYKQASLERLAHWKNTPEGLLALIIILDQFPRNMFRDTPQAFSTDEKALNLVKYALHHIFDKQLSKNEYKHFLYLPLMHSENLEDQKLCLDLFKEQKEQLKYAKQHYEIIKKFGRFPHRNKILGRISSPKEIQFLKQPNSSF
ncbi:DUF924 domain-containing protein [Holosporaceae bacterium 'Namur']|nr:DUF924 domain-containing protein [Holosporaceae bacterium 'Namur']